MVSCVVQDGDHAYIRLNFNFGPTFEPGIKFPQAIFLKELSYRTSDTRHATKVWLNYIQLGANQHSSTCPFTYKSCMPPKSVLPAPYIISSFISTAAVTCRNFAKYPMHFGELLRILMPMSLMDCATRLIEQGLCWVDLVETVSRTLMLVHAPWLQVVQEIKVLRSSVSQREKERAERATLVQQERLVKAKVRHSSLIRDDRLAAAPNICHLTTPRVEFLGHLMMFMPLYTNMCMRICFTA